MEKKNSSFNYDMRVERISVFSYHFFVLFNKRGSFNERYSS